MSKISKLNIEEKLPIIRTLINNNEPDIKPNIITIYSISKCFNVSFIEAIILLNEYVLNESDLSNYAIFFLCEMVDDSGTCFSKKIISSCDPNVNKILEDTKHTLSYGVFGICNLNEYYLMENYQPFIGENELITRFDFSDVPKNSFSSLNDPKDNNVKKESKVKDKKAMTKKEKDNKQIAKKVNPISEKEEENYFGDFHPNKKPKTDKDKISLGVGEKNKRKRNANNDDKSLGEDNHHKKNKSRKELSEDEDEDDKKKHNHNNNINLGSIKEENKDEDIQMKDNTEEGNKNEPKKVKKIRKVKKTKRFLNEEGYMVTKDVESEEEYWSDEKPEKKVVKNNFINQESKPNKNKKKVNKGQTTLNSFFIK